jgi:hypothetical protein
LTSTLSKYLSHCQLDLDQAVFDTITIILGAIQDPAKIGHQSIQQVARIWAEYNPSPEASSLSGSNQDVYQSYVRALRDIYRLSAETVTTEIIEGLVSNLRHIIRTSDASAYSSDVDSMTRLQKEVLDTISLLRTDVNGAVSSITALYADFLSLPFSETEVGKGTRKPTYIALAKASMESASTFVSAHIARRELYNNALLKLLQGLEHPVNLKYSWKKQGKPPLLWQKSTTTALAILELIVPRLGNVGLQEQLLHQYWDTIVRVAKGIASADVGHAADDAPIFDEEDFDVDALSTLGKIVIPALGAEQIPDTTRRAYARALFDNSIIHAPESEELPNLRTEPLKDLYYIRFGRTYNPEPTLRGSMDYHCLGYLISLVSRQDSSPERIKLAQAAAPYLILRAAMTLRLYIADHPLRGRYMPLPSSQREELLFVFKNVRELESEPKAIPETEGLKTEDKRHLVRLYPLIVKAIEVEGRRAKPDDELLGEMSAALEVVGNEFML